MRLTRANGIIGFLTIVLAVFSATMLAPYRSYDFSQLIEWIDWYVLIVYGYWIIAVPLIGTVIGILTFKQKRWIWKVNIGFQVITVIALLSSVYVFGWGLEYNSGVSTRNFSLGLSIVILSLLVMLNKTRTKIFLNRVGSAIYARNSKVVSVSAILLIILFWSEAVDPLFAYTHVIRDTMKNPADSNESMYVYVRQSSPTLAANTPATVEIIVNMNYTYRQSGNLTANDNQPDSFFVIFEGTECGAIYRPGETCVNTLPRIHENYYRGSYYPITYGRDGDYNITLAMDLSTLENRSTTDIPVVHVSPTEATTEFRTFKMSIIIGIIAAAIGFIALFQKNNTRS